MCGINACVHFNEPVFDGERIVHTMNNALLHRGPDGEGLYASPSGHAVLGNRRLSIVDVPGGAMPIRVVHGGAEYAITANGEFFNYKEVRVELEKKYEFKTQSDVEVALIAYIEWGDTCTRHLRGQFAFVIYDGKRECVFLARDRVGIKPLYYALDNGLLLVSSEPKGVLACPGFKRKPDARAIADYFLGILTIGKSESLDRSFFEGVFALPPGYQAIFDSTGLRVERYYEVEFVRRNARVDDLGDVLKKEVERAVSEQIPGEVGYGVALSGGLDSSIITVLAARSEKHPAAVATIRYENQENEDFKYASILASHENIPLSAPLLTPQIIISRVDDLVRALDRPYDSHRHLGILEAYRTIRATGAKVALIGEGADEFNLGYFYRLPGFKDGAEEVSTADGFRAFLGRRAKAVSDYFVPEFISEELVNDIIRENVRRYYTDAHLDTSLDKMQYYYMKKFLKGRLDLHDRTSMSISLEVRVPFCDEGVIDASLAVLPEMNLAGGKEKAILRKAFMNSLPVEIVNRKKEPTPENSSTEMFRVTLDAFDSACASAEPEVWDILNKKHALRIRDSAEAEISEAEQGAVRSLGDGASLTKPIDFRIRHLFVILTFLRWHDLYFSKKMFT